MPKGYWIANVDVTHPEEYKAYVAANAEPLRRYGARFLVRGGKSECMEGEFRSRMVVIEFPNYASALECYRSPFVSEWGRARPIFSLSRAMTAPSHKLRRAKRDMPDTLILR